MSPNRWLLPLLFSGAAAASASAEPLTFDQALQRAQTSEPGLQAQSLRVEAATSAARAAAALPDPRLAVGVENFPISGPAAGRFGDDEMTMARIGVMQDVPNTSKRRARAERAEAEISVAEAGRRVETREVLLASALAWIDLHYAKRRLAALGEVEQALEPLFATAPSSVAAGASRPAQAVEPEQLMAALADRRSELDAEVGKARAALARWTGDPAADAVGEPPTFEIDPVELRASLDRHPQLLAVAAEGRQADAEVSLAKAEKRPDWGWEVAYQRRDPMFGDMVSAGVTVSLPLFTRDRQDPVIEARLKDANRLRIEQEANRRELVAALEADLAEHAMHHDRLERARTTLVPLAKRRADLETASYGAGTASLSDVIDAFTDLAEARLELLDRESETARDAARLVLAYGTHD
ncbi:TolC family protein [Caulobacter sp. 17J65-9]|uniref:TolC family protein n=1 Tax=Caulobacter sp. 17J65-9 TaxID=2709382 RepID=UPI0013CC1A5A|nr:TolC family protein [Caulobacter sp. 17J65-9]NEX91254.1 TolC family protein [Caulobacter sp. 17J65-9]